MAAAMALVAGTGVAVAAGPVARADRWIATWGTAQMPLDAKDALPRTDGVTIRQTVRVSAGGTAVRIRLSNAFGTEPLAIGRARLDGHPLTFAGRPGTDIPAGAEIYSDPVPTTVAPGADLTITLFLPRAPTRQTGHPGARATTQVAPGDQVDAPALADAQAVTRWFLIADVEVRPATATAGTIAVIGDSITDGYGVKPDSNTRWTDAFAARLRASTALAGWGVVNAGIGGNRVALDGLGPNMVARFDRDVIARAGVRHVIVLGGVNDIGTLTRDAPASPAEHAALVRRVTAGYVQMAARARAHGLRPIGGTITPFASNDYYHPGPASEADRQAINAFIRTSGVFDAVIDFDAALRDPARPDRLAKPYDSGDGLHPSDAGYRAMADAVPLTLFTAPLAAARQPAPTIALTFDDIPVHGPLPPGTTRTATLSSIAATLKGAGIPAHGFLNGAAGAGDADAASATAAWVRAGLAIGNHGLEHKGASTLDAAGFRDQLVRNEAAVDAASGRPAARWFRYPYLDEGKTVEARDAARAVLAERGYRIAAVTADFADYGYNAPYARCRAKGDAVAIAGLERRWLAAAERAVTTARARTRALTGREVPLVLLMHVGAFDAHMLPRTIALFRRLGFGFVDLAAAQADPFYAAASDPRIAGNSPALDRLAGEAGLPPPAPAPAEPSLDTICA